MRVDVIMPQMGESIAEGTLTKWLKKPGEKVARDEPIFEISTDKVDAEIPSPSAGVLAEVKVQEGQTVPINTVVALIETDGGAAATASQAAPAPAKEAPAQEAPAAPAKAPAAQADGAPTAKAASQALQPGPQPQAAPRPAQAAAPASSGKPEFPKASAMAAGGASEEEIRRVRSSPVVRKIAEEQNVDISRLQGTGSGGRVTKKDILSAIDSGGAASGAAAPMRAPGPVAHMPAYAPGERVNIVPMTNMRKKIAEHMILSKQTSAHVTQVTEVDMQATMKLRAKHKAAFEERNGAPLTVTAFMVRAAVEALQAFPIVNSSIDGDNIVYKKDLNIGIAVALDWGLIVPVIRNAGDLSLSGIAKAVRDLADRARSKKLSPDEVQGGTFTITNPGGFGSLFGTPIINQPQVAIMGVGSIDKRPVVVDDAIAIHYVCYMTLSFDHRLIDGAIGAQFMSHVKETLQEARFPDIA
ncbi:MAG TPA: dihydrolipoamide acetyltransferase family protein [Candidatus Polarisedimenticolia bacterium]|jgi:2-oxoglutarate dehydrogenase E2 component (dihydrolipoamide succinyltransferase)|nr:dihydrolipoamide acetyltransferase family protein [Candidatus Polarisedimenticolia bacterium]